MKLLANRKVSPQSDFSPLVRGDADGKVKDRPKVTVLICTLNEEENLPHVLPSVPNWVDEVLIVDGRSTDGTVEVARSLRPDVRIEYQPGEGKGDALRHGIRRSDGDIIVMLDADGENDPEEILRFLKPLMHGYDFAKGSRFYPGFFPRQAFHRSIGNLLLAVAFDLLFLRPFTDVCSGYNAFWKRAIMRVDLGNDGDFAAEPTLLARAWKSGLRIKEVGHSDRGRLAGEAKVPTWWRHGIWVLTTILRERIRG
jgi:glycosyltransferase involved in cell wall biosynthesis